VIGGRPVDHDYHFISRWRVEGTCGEVADILGDPLQLPRWWPAVYLDVREESPGGAGGIGRRVRFHTKGWLPYTLVWHSTTTVSRYPHGFNIAASGDFAGTGVWTFEQDGPFVNVTYDWQVRAEKPLLRRLSFLLRPVFAANHQWAMRQGEESLRLELARRRATSAEARRAIDPPPGPTTLAGVALLAGGALAVGALVWVIVRRGRDHRRTR
jgi:hypothetical protein